LTAIYNPSGKTCFLSASFDQLFPSGLEGSLHALGSPFKALLPAFPFLL
jgi:hypothetical protein